ncbi:MAG TPA: hypothetical protein VN873_16320 [Candidatus Angelobacter sp.]|nr:hypothetical protein [Candidatus Angelobacter sp.]
MKKISRKTKRTSPQKVNAKKALKPSETAAQIGTLQGTIRPHIAALVRLEEITKCVLQASTEEQVEHLIAATDDLDFVMEVAKSIVLNLHSQKPGRPIEL